MIIKKEFYKEVYFVESPEYLTKIQWNNLLMVGNKNWDNYFLPFKTKRSFEKIDNIELVEFDTKDSMFKYIKNVDSNLVLNFSLEHKNPCLIRFT